MALEDEEVIRSSDKDEEKNEPPVSDPPKSTEDAEDEKGGDEVEGEGDEDEDEEEYEIEAILDAKKGSFGKNRIGYLVKWKGYGSEHNSWVSEDDAGNATDLISEYWAEFERKKKLKSAGKVAKSSPSVARSAASRDRSNEVTAGSKRARRSSKRQDALEPEEEDELEEEDDIPKPAKKRTKPNVVGNGRSKPESTNNAKVPASDNMDVDMDGQKPPAFSNMDKYMSDKNWDGLVQTVDTVERLQNGELVIFFTLKNGERIREKSSLCARRFPLKLIDFYESNLRWRMAEEEP